MDARPDKAARTMQSKRLNRYRECPDLPDEEPRNPDLETDMTNIAMLNPVAALVSWTGFVLLLIPFARFRAAFRRRVTADDFKFGESGSVPPDVSIPNRNYMNLLEAPMIFYLACVLGFVTAGVTPSTVLLAWAHVALWVLVGMHISALGTAQDYHLVAQIPA